MRSLRRKNKLVSALPPLTPTSIINTGTGEYLTPVEFARSVGSLMDFVVSETARLYEKHEAALNIDLQGYRGVPQPAEYARQHGIKGFLNLTKNIKATSRIEKLIQYKLVSETASYILNPNPDKQKHSYSRVLNLGAVDKQMATMSVVDDELTLIWKCWDAEYYLTFKIPAYVLKRNIVKYSLPLVKQDRKTGEFAFIFTTFETITPRKGSAHAVGIDLGVIKPYSMVVANRDGQRVASYETSSRLTQLARKRERLQTETRNIRTKISNRATRGLSSPTQEQELERTRDKTTRLTKTITLQIGSEVTRKLIKHNSNLIQVENLKWVSGFTGSKIGSSRWSHSQQQEAITHATTRAGFTVRKVSARNTSQTCHGCGEQITHRAGRTVWCEECHTSVDRDFNAAMNIAKPTFPASKKLNGDITHKSDVIFKQDKAVLSGTFTLPLLLLARKVT